MQQAPSKYPSWKEFQEEPLAHTINDFLNTFDPNGTAANEANVGASYCAVLAHYGRHEVHPTWIAATHTLIFVAIIGLRRGGFMPSTKDPPPPPPPEPATVSPLASLTRKPGT